ncbi:hypothetical protein GCM10010421_23290 [Streptomyces glaucus]|uniref:Secreted protein n=1 Tax=Streptomyces glaucus TaxID=284029 RepID=A0ABN3JL19_9ACTN
MVSGFVAWIGVTAPHAPRSRAGSSVDAVRPAEREVRSSTFHRQDPIPSVPRDKSRRKVLSGGLAGRGTAQQTRHHGAVVLPQSRIAAQGVQCLGEDIPQRGCVGKRQERMSVGSDSN